LFFDKVPNEDSSSKELIACLNSLKVVGCVSRILVR